MPTKGNDFNSMTKQPAALTATAGRMVTMRNVTDTVGDENIFSASGHKGASRQKQRTSQHYQAELPSEESAGGGAGRQAGLIISYRPGWRE